MLLSMRPDRKNIIELRHLRSFVMIAEEGSFTKAAYKLHIEQPPLSKQIQDLEEELHITLFDRSKKPIQVTPAGEQLLEQAKFILTKVEQLTQTADNLRDGKVGRLRIGHINFALYYPEVVRVLKAFRTKYPQVELELQELRTDEQFEALSKSQIDLGLAMLPIENKPALDSKVLLKDRFVIVLPEGHKLSKQDKVYLSELSQENFLLHPHYIGSLFYDKIIRLCNEAGFLPKVTQEVIQMHSIASLVSAYMGVALVPNCIKNIGTKGVVFKELTGQTSELTLGLVWRKEDEASVILNNFLTIT